MAETNGGRRRPHPQYRARCATFTDARHGFGLLSRGVSRGFQGLMILRFSHIG